MKLKKVEKMVQIPREFFGEMSDDDFHDFLHKQNGCLNQKQWERVKELLQKNARSKKGKPRSEHSGN